MKQCSINGSMKEMAFMKELEQTGIILYICVLTEESSSVQGTSRLTSVAGKTNTLRLSFSPVLYTARISFNRGLVADLSEMWHAWRPSSEMWCSGLGQIILSTSLSLLLSTIRMFGFQLGLSTKLKPIQ